MREMVFEKLISLMHMRVGYLWARVGIKISHTKGRGLWGVSLGQRALILPLGRLWGHLEELLKEVGIGKVFQTIHIFVVPWLLRPCEVFRRGV